MTKTQTVTAADIYTALIMRATPGQIEAASIWYRDAEDVARKVAQNQDTSLEVGAAVVSAFSPRERWSTNVAKALAFSRGETPNGLSNNIRMARNALLFGFDALKGLKTNAFARAIAGDTNAVVIDIWMCRAAGLDTDSPNVTQYRMLSDSVREAAAHFGLTPRTAQALIWIIARGGAA